MGMSAIQFIKAPCGCYVDCPSKVYLLFGSSEKHKAEHREYDAGIIHSWDCGMVMIKIPKLIINPKFLKE